MIIKDPFQINEINNYKILVFPNMVCQNLFILISTDHEKKISDKFLHLIGSDDNAGRFRSIYSIIIRIKMFLIFIKY